MTWRATTLGNHEFDEGCLELKECIKIATTPVLATNLDADW